jgi:hypothetical protein
MVGLTYSYPTSQTAGKSIDGRVVLIYIYYLLLLIYTYILKGIDTHADMLLRVLLLLAGRQ